MIDASHNVPLAKYSLSDLGFDVAIKTGTPQISNDLQDQNSFFIGFAPANDPEIAFAGVIEHGEFSKYMIRDIILAYQECYGLNGVGPTLQNKTLPEEVLPELNGVERKTTTTTTTTTTAPVITTTTTTAAQPVPTNPVPEVPSQQPAVQTEQPTQPASTAPTIQETQPTQQTQPPETSPTEQPASLPPEIPEQDTQQGHEPE